MISGKLMSFDQVHSVTAGTRCKGSLQLVITKETERRNIFGQVFFAAYYGIFDTSVPKLCFATIK